MMVLGGGVFVRYLCHEGATLINGISALIKRVTERFLAPYTTWRYKEKPVTQKRALSNYADTLILDF